MSESWDESNVSRRAFLLHAAAFIAGCVSASTALFTLWKGKKAEPFLSRSSLAVLKRFGLGQDLFEALELPYSEQYRLAERILKIKNKYDAQQSIFRRGNFSQILCGAIEHDFARGDVIMVKRWLLTRTEVGIYAFNLMNRSGLIVA
ncbi:MAG: hypothetical protein JXO51_06805 [Candidatus Aminicenantes bacterium]|nr:hypothetical protein [Candidatus Aminicenantes bacterium]